MRADAATGDTVADSNPAYYNVAGPVHIYVRIPSVGVGPFIHPDSRGGPILFLGHAEDSPEPDFVPQYIPVHSSLAGPVVPDDEIFMGGDFKIQTTFTRFSWDVVQLLQAWPQYGRGAAPGSETFLDRGRLVQAQGDSFEIWFRNAFYGTANAAAYPNMPIGHYYPCCRSLGTYPRKLSRDATRATLGIKPLSARQGITGGFITYSCNPKYFAALPEPG